MTSSGTSDDELQSELNRLKEQGCTLLVTGAVPEEVRHRATQRLFGSPDADRKRILVVGNGAAVDARRYLPSGVTPESADVSLIDWGSRTRKAVDACATATPPDTDALRWLRTTIIDAVVSYDAEAGDARLAPAELRLAFDSLDVLLESHDRHDVECLVRATTALIRGVNGLGHFHLASRDDDCIDALAPLFDARVELRRRQGKNPEQRWHVPSYGSTEWMRL